MRNALDGHASTLDAAKEKIPEHEYVSTEPSRSERQREKKLGNKNPERNIQGLRNYRIYTVQLFWKFQKIYRKEQKKS